MSNRAVSMYTPNALKSEISCVEWSFPVSHMHRRDSRLAWDSSPTWDKAMDSTVSHLHSNSIWLIGDSREFQTGLDIYKAASAMSAPIGWH